MHNRILLFGIILLSAAAVSFAQSDSAATMSVKDTSDKAKADAYMMNALADKIEGKYESAIAQYTKAIEAYQKHDEAYLKRAEVYILMGKRELAVKDLEQALKINPNHTQARKHLSDVAAATKAAPVVDRRVEADRLIKEAEKLFEEAAIEIEKGNTTNARVNVILGLDTIDKAIGPGISDAAYAKAFEVQGLLHFAESMNPANKNPSSLRATAINSFDTAIRQNPKNSRSYFARGLTYEQSGEKAKAKADFQKAIELDPESSDAREGLKRVGG